MIDHEHWLEAQEEERQWWGDCLNTYWEERKQIVYAELMGLEFYGDNRSPYNINAEGKRIMDIGGGPTSLLLKTTNRSPLFSVVVDPCKYPDWVDERYFSNRILLDMVLAEEIKYEEAFDEVWMYNCLQHTEDPQLIIDNGIRALKPGGIFRVFEWVNIPTDSSHPHTLTKEGLDQWFGRRGDTINLSAEGCYGEAYYGAFS